MAHANARLGPAGRRELVRLICELGWPEAAAECLSVSPATAHRWKRRWLTPRRGARVGGLGGGSLKPAASLAARTPRRDRAAGLAARERTGWGPRLIAGETGIAHSTVHAILSRHGCSRTPRPAREAFRRYEWPCPGDLLHMDVKRYPRFRRPGTRSPATAAHLSDQRDNPLGHDYFHAIVDDHSRLAYGELLDDERAATVTAFLERALAWFAAPRHHRPAADDRRRAGPTATTARCASCSPSARSATSSPRPTRRAGTGRSSAFTRRWNASGPRACATATAPPATAHCHTGCATTTSADPTAHSAANPRSAALTTSQGRTASAWLVEYM